MLKQAKANLYSTLIVVVQINARKRLWGRRSQQKEKHKQRQRQHQLVVELQLQFRKRGRRFH